MLTKEKIKLKAMIYRVLKPIIIIAFVVLVGILGYWYIEGWNTLDSFYMSVISLTTVGYEIPHNLSKTGKIFTCFYLIFSVIIFLYLASEFAHHVISLKLEDIFTRRQMDSRIKSLKKHYIICGFGRTGRAIAAQLEVEKVDYVIIDKNIDVITEARSIDNLAIVGDCTNELILQEARITNAKGLFAVLSDDADNLFLTITAKDMKPDIDIVVRCSKAGNEEKFKKVGVQKVISPFTISGKRMVSSVLRPLVADFLEEVMNTKVGLELRMEEFFVPEDASIVNKPIVDTGIRPKSGAYVIAIKREQNFIHNPTADIVIKPNDYLIILGSTDQLLRFEDLINQKGTKISS
jgi:voltage-gated potassium channel